MFIAGAGMLVAGLIPVTVAAIAGGASVSDVSFLSVFAPVGACLMALARSKASREWRQAR
jgi:hypothetical protein